MPRRMIDSEIWRNEKVSNLPDAGRLLFIGIFSNADDDGRLKASPRFLKATIFPYDDGKTADQIRELRDQCAEPGLIRVYSKNGKEYLDIPGWEEHQKIRKDRYTPSKLPGYNEADNQMATQCQPMGNHPTTAGSHSIGEGRLGKFSIVTPLLEGKGARNKRASPAGEKIKSEGHPLKEEAEVGSPEPEKKSGKKEASIVLGIFSEMRRFLGYPEDKVCGPGSPTPGEKKEAKVCGGEAVPALEESSAGDARSKREKGAIDPIPNYGKEGKAIKRMLTRGFTREEILACWKGKVSQRGGEFISMTWVNEDIGQTRKQKRRPRELSTEAEIAASIKEVAS